MSFFIFLSQALEIEKIPDIPDQEYPVFFQAGAEGFEPSARGFGDHCSTS